MASARADRALVLLDILNRYMLSRAADGSDTETGREIVQAHFFGARALFTDESSTNLAAFSRELTFADPVDAEMEILASWHGKVSRRFFRLHFAWPVPALAAKLKVLYYGPKLTKS